MAETSFNLAAAVAAGGALGALGRYLALSWFGHRLGTGFPYQRDEVVDRNVEYVRRFLRAGCHGVRRAGSAAIDLAHTAAGVLDGFWELRLRPWDVAAGTLIAREAGCTVSDLAGLARDLQWEEVLAAPPDLHVAMRGIIAGEPDAEGGPS